MTGWTGDLDAPAGARWSPASPNWSAAAQHRRCPTHSADASPTEPLLAVLAFDNLSGDSGDGLLLRRRFGGDPADRGARRRAEGDRARSSSFQFRGADKAAARSRRELKATHVLDGSVRRSGGKRAHRRQADRVRRRNHPVVGPLRPATCRDVFALQDEIAAAVAEALKVAFAPTVKAEAIDPVAYNLYLKARDIRNNGLLSPPTVVEVIELLDEATRRGPKFARAWEFLATMQVEHLRFDEARQPEAIQRADVVAAAEAALRLDPSLGAAYQALGQLQPFGSFAEREALHRKALSVAPNDPTVLTNASLFFAEVGRIAKSLKYAAQAYALDPMYPWAASWYGVTLEYAGKGEDCVGLWKSLCERWPDNELIVWGAVCAAAGYRDWAWFDELLETVAENGFASPTLRGAITWGEALRDPTDKVLARELERVKARLGRTGVLPLFRFAELHIYGLTEETFELIAQSSFDYMFDPEMGSPNGAEGPSMIFNANINMAMIRDVRFVGLCARLGLCAYWATSDCWPDCADEGVAPYDFKAEARRLAAA